MVFQEVDGLFMDVLGLLGLLHLGRAGARLLDMSPVCQVPLMRYWTANVGNTRLGSKGCWN